MMVTLLKKYILKALILFSTLFLFSGCIFVAGAAAGAAAIAVVYDHRTLQNSMQDTQIANQIVEKIHRVPALRNDSHIEVTVFNRIVLLTGETPNLQWKQDAENLASVPGVTRIYNQLLIQGPTSSLTRTSDAWITTKIKGQMLATDDLKSSSIKVVTEDGTVYLMGIVTRQQASLAVDIAREVSGVQRVIKIFQYKN